VATGVAEHLRMPVPAVRWALAGLALVGGVGAVGYLLLWALVPQEQGWQEPAGADATRTAHGARPPRRWSPADGAGAQVLLGLALVGGGAAALAPPGVLHRVLPVLVPAAVAGAGVVVAWSQLDAERGRWLVRAAGEDRDTRLRVVLGVALAAAGLALLVLRGTDASAIGPALTSALTVLAGVGLLLAPWGLRLVRDLREERAGRLREAQRAEVAAHLHDSVLQTLALIQRSSTDPTTVVRLARAQERELRAWLYGGAQEPPGTSVAQAVRAQVAEVEDASGVPVEVVVVGDRAVDRSTEALVQALREAVLNAVRHGRPPVQVYLEAGAGAVEAFVRDHGVGFDPGAVPPDRLGVRESVVGRMARAGGSATIRRAPGGGTEVALRVERPEEER
jgi:signal transduction histidine kinase/phage shock protein PspC (stress-responsive transcriptional regulator)